MPDWRQFFDMTRRERVGAMALLVLLAALLATLAWYRHRPTVLPPATQVQVEQMAAQADSLRQAAAKAKVAKRQAARHRRDSAAKHRKTTPKPKAAPRPRASERDPNRNVGTF